MKKIKLLSIVVIVLFLSSCAIPKGGFITSTTSLSSNNFKTVQHLEGHSQAIFIVGFGGALGQKGLVANAKENLLKSNPDGRLKDGQALANVTIDFKTTYITFVYVTYSCTMTADVVEFTK